MMQLPFSNMKGKTLVNALEAKRKVRVYYFKDSLVASSFKQNGHLLFQLHQMTLANGLLDGDFLQQLV